METIQDITAEMREFADVDAHTIGRDVLRRRIQHFARRIDEATAQCNQLKMREALEWCRGFMHNTADDIERIDAALSTPPRNCDVGTVEEQVYRFEKFCREFAERHKPCKNCPCDEAIDCRLAWAQLPYERGGAE